MATKTLTIMDDAYGMLLSLKKPEESFSDEIRRLASTRGSIIEFAGAWSDITEGEAKKMKVRINERRNDRSRLNELHKKR